MSDSIEPYHGESHEFAPSVPSPPKPRKEWTIERTASSGKYITLWWQENELPEPRSNDYSTKWGYWHEAVEKVDGLYMHIMNHGVRGVRVRLEKYDSYNWRVVEVGYPLDSNRGSHDWIVVVEEMVPDYEGAGEDEHSLKTVVHGFDTEQTARDFLAKKAWAHPEAFLALVDRGQKGAGDDGEEEAKA